MKSFSGLLDRDKSQLGECGELTPDKGVLASVQIPSLTSLSPVAQVEFLDNQILEIGRGHSCFDINDGDVSTSDGLAVAVPFQQDFRSDLAPTTKPCGKVVPARQKKLVRVDSDYVISTNTGGSPVKRTSEANALDGLLGKCRTVS
nr:hypothetical protein CFP56_12473 [Quercus suber]